MKVNGWKNIDVEVEIEVSLNDCINEMLDRAEKEGDSLKITAVDGATKILEKVTPDVLAARPDAIEIVRGRLAKWMKALDQAEAKAKGDAA